MVFPSQALERLLKNLNGVPDWRNLGLVWLSDKEPGTDWCLKHSCDNLLSFAFWFLTAASQKRVISQALTVDFNIDVQVEILTKEILNVNSN